MEITHKIHMNEEINKEAGQELKLKYQQSDQTNGRGQKIIVIQSIKRIINNYKTSIIKNRIS
jgi:hypothetical protein